MKMPFPYTTLAQKPIWPIFVLISCVPGMDLHLKRKSAKSLRCNLLKPSANNNLLKSPSIRRRFPCGVT